MSGLNPGAAPYSPVEDYSPEWWELVGSSPWFRDYWLRDRFLDPENAPDPIDIYDSAIPDDDDLRAFFLDHDADDTEDGKGGERRKEMVVWGAEKWRMSRRRAEVARFGERAPKIVKIVRASPRPIQQPK